MRERIFMSTSDKPQGNIATKIRISLHIKLFQTTIAYLVFGNSESETTYSDKVKMVGWEGEIVKTGAHKFKRSQRMIS